jgi:hypothetical protein
MNTHEHSTAALAAVQALHRLAKLEADPEAIEALRDIALRAIGVLDLLTTAPADHPDTPERIRPGITAAREIAKQSARWPVALDAVKEIREDSLARWQKLEVGSAIGIRLAGKNRGFSYDEQTGFALDVFRELEAIRKNPARHLHPADAHPELAAPGRLSDEQLKRDWRNLAALLEPLTKETLPDWTTAGIERCREDCHGDWQNFPWPDCVMGKTGKDTDGNGSLRSAESAIRGKILDGLKALIS